MPTPEDAEHDPGSAWWSCSRVMMATDHSSAEELQHVDTADGSLQPLQ